MASIGTKDCFDVVRMERVKKMTAERLALLVECYHLGTDLAVGQTAARRDAANFLVRAGLVTFRDAQVPQNGLQITERGRRHVERLLALPIRQEPQEGPQNGQEGPMPRFVWGYAEDPANKPLAAQQCITEWLGNPETSQFQMVALVTSMFVEALTWDQQARVLERMGWKRAAI